MADTIRKQIISAVESKLAAITTTNGFQTSIGSDVRKVSKNNDPDDVPMCIIWPGDEQASTEYGYVISTMQMRVEGIENISTSNPSDVSEKLLADIIECMTGPAWTMPFTSGGTTEIEPGQTITGAASSATGYVMNVSLSTGAWEDGNAAGTFTIRRKTGTFGAENLNVGASLNLATTTGVLTYVSDIQSTTSSLADQIEYVSGGAGEYPDNADIIVGAYANFNIKYKYLIGNPYSQ